MDTNKNTTGREKFNKAINNMGTQIYLLEKVLKGTHKPKGIIVISAAS